MKKRGLFVLEDTSPDKLKKLIQTWPSLTQVMLEHSALKALYPKTALPLIWYNQSNANLSVSSDLKWEYSMESMLYSYVMLQVWRVKQAGPV